MWLLVPMEAASWQKGKGLLLLGQHISQNREGKLNLLLLVHMGESRRIRPSDHEGAAKWTVSSDKFTAALLCREAGKGLDRAGLLWLWGSSLPKAKGGWHGTLGGDDAERH